MKKWIVEVLFYTTITIVVGMALITTNEKINELQEKNSKLTKRIRYLEGKCYVFMPTTYLDNICHICHTRE